MKNKLRKSVTNVTNLGEVQTKVIEVLKTIREGNARIGYVSGIITSDGGENIGANLKRLSQYTEKIRKQQNFPVFSSTDVFTEEIFSKIKAERYAQDCWHSFWREILESKHITDIFMTPRWEKSRGAKVEHKTAKELGITLHYICRQKTLSYQLGNEGQKNADKGVI